MADYRDVSDEFVELLDGISGIGQIFDYPPDLREPEKFKDLATSWDDELNLPIINVWFVERVSARDIRGGTQALVPLTKAIRLDTYRVTGLYGYAKGGQTYFEFQALVELVLDKFLEHISLSHVASNWVARAAVLRRIDLQTFGDYLSHIAEIEIEVERDIPVTFQ